MEIKDHKLEVELGAPVQLQFGVDAGSRRYATKIIGYAHLISIILSTPQNSGKPLLLREDQIVTVRFIGPNNAYAFVSNVQAVFLKPFPHIHITYPTTIKSSLVRQEERVRTDISAKVVNLDETPVREENIKVINISSSGALIANEGQVLGKVGERLRMSISVAFHDMEKHVSVIGIIRSVREGAHSDIGYYLHGVQFEIKSINEHLMVQGAIYSQMSRT